MPAMPVTGMGKARDIVTSRLAEFSRAVSTPFPILTRTRVGRLVPSDAKRGRPASAHDRHIDRPDRLRSLPGNRDVAIASRPGNRW